MAGELRERVREGARVLGGFVKIASYQVAELFAAAELDFAVIDAEHAPFDLADIDRIVLAARGAGLPCLVRPPDRNPTFLGQCMDLGAAGALAPHVANAEAAHGVVAAIKYASGRRGFSPSTRAGAFAALSPAAYRLAADAASSLWCQIEDAEALENLDAIAAVDEVDCLFLGRADLALSLGVERQDDGKVVAAVEATARAARRHGRAAGVYVGDPAEIAPLSALGITVFICGSDQSFLLAQARANKKAFAAAARR